MKKRKYAYVFVYFIFLLIGIHNVVAQNPPSGFASVTVSDQWKGAVGLTFSEDGTEMFVWERGGKVWVVKNNQRQILIDITEEVGSWHDHGLLGFALHPHFEQNGYFYLFYLVDRHHLMNYGTAAYSSTTNDFFTATIGRLTRYTATRTATGYTVNPASRKILIGATRSTGIPSIHRSHVVGSLVFGTDETLLVSTGDGAAASLDYGSATNSYYAQALIDGIITPAENVGTFRAQLLESHNGKILRINPETGAGIPSNPFYDASRPFAPISKVYTLGCRQPFKMSLKPGTGSHNPADGNPGIIYYGEVGFNAREEINIVDKAGMNMGWPIYEGYGLSVLSPYITPNLTAPNPLYQVNGCTQQYFSFQDLLKQATASGQTTFPNPCNTGQSIPSSIKTFMHSRPVIDWAQDQVQSRTGIFNGETAAVINIGAPGSPVAGPQFDGTCSVGGVFYTGSDFPPTYQNTYFFGDFSGSWIRNLRVDANDKPVEVRNFVGGGAIVVGMAAHPTEEGLYYIHFDEVNGEIRKIYYSANRPPVAVASVNKTYGPSPLNIQFTGSNSTDPENLQLTYEWNFGDGSPLSTIANPTHSFTAPPGVPTKYTITLKVRDNQGVTDQTSLIISVNNTPPQVSITSPVNNALYPMTGETTYPLRATVTDQEHSMNQLSYQWQTVLHHENHQHPEPVDTSPQTSANISPLGCDGETYYYSIALTVTDAAGASATKEVRLYPDCGGGTGLIFYRAINLNGAALTIDGNPWQASASAPNFTYTTNKGLFANQTIPLIPATDANRSTMIRSSIWGQNLTLTVSSVPAGTYQVWLYVWEDNLPQTYSVSLEGTVVQANYNSGGPGIWKKLGPFQATVNDGAINISATGAGGGYAQPSGLEIWSVSQSGGNQPPVVANAIPDQTATAGTAFNFTFPASTFSDPNAGTTLTYSASLSSGAALPAWLNFNASTRNFSGTPGSGNIGTLNVRVTASDGAGGSVNDVFALTVNSASSTAFYRAINLNGAALTIDGNPWQASTSAPNFTYTTNQTVFANQTITLIPATDVNRATMIRSSIWGGNVTLTVSSVPAGSYQVWLYVWEDNLAQTYSISLEGTVVRANYNSGSAGTWSKLGPFQATINDGTINVSATGGAANLSGLEIWSVSQSGGNQPPVVANAIPDQTATAGMAFNFTFPASTFSDPNAGTTLTYSASLSSGAALPAWLNFNASTRNFSGTPGSGNIGTLNVRVTASDGAGGSVNDVFALTVNSASSTAFYRAINLNGAALTIDGNPWQASTSAPNFTYTTNQTVFANQTITLIPATDVNRATMIRSSIWGGNVTLTVSSVPAGSYQVWLYVWEDNLAQTYSISLEGTVVRANYNSGSAGTWSKLGPFQAAINDGTINVSATGGAANLSGLEIWSVNQSAGARQAFVTATEAVDREQYSDGLQLSAYPNPFSVKVNITFTAVESAATRLTMYDTRGVQVRVVFEGSLLAGEQEEVEMEAPEMPDGVYVLKLVNGELVKHFKLTIAR